MHSVTLHSNFNRIVAVVAWGLSAAMLVTAAVTSDASLAPLYPASALLAFSAWAALWRPSVRVDDAGVTLQNVTHRVEVPWAALVHVDTRHALTLRTPGRKFVAWSAPAPGFLSATLAGRRPSNREARAAGESLRPGDLLGTESGDAAVLVREGWQRRLDSGLVEVGVAEHVRVERQWDTFTIAVIGALAVTTVWTLVASG